MNKMYKEIIVCYDISSDRRRKKFFEEMKDLGLSHVQKSVFWGYLNNAEIKSVYRSFEKSLNKESDQAFLTPVNLLKNVEKSTFGYEEGVFKEMKSYETV